MNATNAIRPVDWKLEGNTAMTDKQRKMLNAVCGDLAVQLHWHGNRLSKDDWRHMLSGTMLGWPSDAHHIKQGQHFTTVALCKDCHQGWENGWHGRKSLWRVMKMDELAALNVTLRRLQLRKAA